MSENYDGSQIVILEGLEAVRKRPGMYIGSTGTRGLHHLIWEILDNGIDEHLAGFCSQVDVTLRSDGGITIRDYGRGVPVDIHPTKKIPTERVVYTVLHAGGKFSGGAYKVSGGLHGVGASVVNALSTKMIVEIRRDGNVYADEYENGGHPVTALVKGELPAVKTCKKSDKGTSVTFYPDDTIFEVTKFKADWLKSRMHESAYLNPGLMLHFKNLRDNEHEETVFHEPEGIVAYVKELNKGKEVMHAPILYKGVCDNIDVEIAIQFVDAFEENILGFCNNIFTQEGGTHIAGFKTKFTGLINTYARDLGILKDKDSNFTGADTRNGMTAIISIKHPNPMFEGQTKTKLASADATRAVLTVTGDELTRFFDRNVDVIKSIISCAEKSAKIRKAEERAKTNMLTKSKFSFESNGKLANCESKDPSKCEIFIVEGDSAGGSAKTARNRNFQAILPIRGKILNVEKASIDKVLANAEIKTMINTFGCGFSEGYGNDFDISKLRYDKIILMTDADVDGSHIDTLLLTFLYRFMPELIYDGHVYIAMPPLFKVVPKRGEGIYLYDEKALEDYKKKHKDNFTLQRYKGLGEMDAEQLWETTLDPERRVLKKVEIEDARLASEVTELLMGSDVAPRRNFIHEHAREAVIDA